MEQRIFIFILYFLQLIRGVLTPLLILVLYPFSRKLRERVRFEQKNLTNINSRSFNKDGLEAHVAFEVSSEGEFEQVKPLLDSFLKENKRVELIYSSTSLEDKLERIATENKNLRVMRLPVASFGLTDNSLMQTQHIKGWLTAPLFILCRYDFFPELLLYGADSKRRFCLVSATLKNKNPNNWFLKRIYHLFDYVLTATATDSDHLKLMGIPKANYSTYEFRILQIAERLKSKDEKLSKYKDIVEWLLEVPRHKRIIVGSAWAVDLKILENASIKEQIKSGELRLLILPHLFQEDLAAACEGIPITHYMDGEDASLAVENIRKMPGLFNLQVKGVLCELYALCGHAFVGGGHGRSVHSLLEPFLAGCHVYCGPKIHRSTEYDFIRSVSPEAITVITDLASFYKHLQADSDENLVARREELSNSFVSDFNNKVDLLSGSIEL